LNGLVVMVGGAFGALCRFMLGNWLTSIFNRTSFPYSMVIVNVIGAFSLGVLLTFSSVIFPFYDKLLLLIATGFFGGFTTFSTFSVETVDLLKKRKYVLSLIYVSITIFGSIFAFFFGRIIINSLM
jgi:fluoride exporter